ncbi:hypothetical protein D6D01_04438 [Aureobasidium pullulans]|uniref:Uncharacterized protein n=1 Tax=Aureobasidium pullulans TaxID=5580 RepID=A0A4S9LC80_AURPU|nr:hypothetical protein D6D01_04438 [Aureobasidium pullulans]
MGLNYIQHDDWAFLPLATNDEIAGKDPTYNPGNKTGNDTDPGQSDGAAQKHRSLGRNTPTKADTVTEHFFRHLSSMEPLCSSGTFQNLVMTVDGLWRKDSQDISSRSSAQNIGLGQGRFHNGSLSVSIKIFSRDDQWCDPTIINYELHHSQHTSDYSFISHEILNIQIIGTSEPKEKSSREWRTIGRTLPRALNNHIGTVDETGILRKSDQPKVPRCFGKTWGPTLAGQESKAKASSVHQNNDDELLLSQVEQKPAGKLSRKTEDFVDSDPPKSSRKQTSLSNVKPRNVASNPDSSKDSRKHPATKEKSWVHRSIFAENPKYKPTKASHVASSLIFKPTTRADAQKKHSRHRSESGGNDGDDGDDAVSLFALFIS